MCFFRIVYSPHGMGHGVVLLDEPNSEKGLPDAINFCISDNEQARTLSGRGILFEICLVPRLAGDQGAELSAADRRAARGRYPHDLIRRSFK